MINIKRAVLAIFIAVTAVIGFNFGTAAAWHIDSGCVSNEWVLHVPNESWATGTTASFDFNVGPTKTAGKNESVTAAQADTTVAVTFNNSGEHFNFNRPQGCTTPTPHATPAAPTYTPPTCSTVGTVVATDTAAVHWTLTGTTSITATATAKAGYVLDGQTVYGPYAVAKLTGQQCKIVSTPVAPTVTRSEVCAVKDTFLAGPTVGVVYTIGNQPPTNNGSVSGSLNQGQVVTITATPAAGYKFAGESQVVTYTIEGGAVEECTVVTTVPPTTVPPTTVPPTTVPPTTTPPTLPPATTVPAPKPPVVPQTLPATGKGDGIGMLALILVGAGSIAALVARRPKHA